MTRLALLLAAAVCVAAPLAAPLAAQPSAAPSKGPITVPGITWAPIANPSFAVPKGKTVKIAVDVDAGGEKPTDLVPGFLGAGGLVNQAADMGMKPGKLKLALVVHGAATNGLMTHEGYRAKFGVDNPNLELLKQLHDAGVQIIVCGQALPRRGVPRESLLPFVQVSLSATWAHAVLQNQGYALLP